ncbi:MAG TPA: hypothetical protein VF285_13095 [Castellaniella sp.]|uniref:hypothetical protein n=1 Tax=Castellaniella sp. TaxID=1955812 RepID=UPI002F122A38
MRQPLDPQPIHPFWQPIGIIREHHDLMALARDADVVGILGRGAAEGFRVVQHLVGGQGDAFVASLDGVGASASS